MRLVIMGSSLPPYFGSSDSDLQELARRIGPLQAMAFDVDGTIADAEGSVGERAVAALRSLSQAGIEPIIVTGRILPVAADPLRRAGHHGIVIASNGTRIGDLATEEIIYSQPMPEEISRLAIQTGRELGLVTVFTLPDRLVVEVFEEGNRWTQGGYAVFKIDVQDLDTVDPTLIYNVMFGHPDPTYLDSLNTELKTRFPYIDRSMTNFYEMTAPGEGKDKGMQILAERKGIDLKKVAGFGDGGNDVSWLREIGHPIAVKNARPEVMEVCEARIGHHADDAVARFIENYLAEYSGPELS